MATSCGRIPVKGDGQTALPRAAAPRCGSLLQLRTGVAVLPRSDGTVQIGCACRGTLRMRPPASLDQRRCLALLSLLRKGHTAAELRAAAKLSDVRPQAVDELLRHVRAAGLLARQEEAPARVHVHGSGPIATGLRSALEENGVLVTATRDTLLRRDIPEHHPELVVLADRVVPDPAIIHQLLVARKPHIQVRLVDGDGQIGPFVLPGRTGCLWCEQQHAADSDPLWSELLRRLGPTCGHAESRVVRATLAQATAEIGHALRFLRGSPRVCAPRVLGAVLGTGHDGVLAPPSPAPAHPKCMFHTIVPHRGKPRPGARRDDLPDPCPQVGAV
ncbi:MAG: hypothetical protein ACRC20_00275 [Segniliparus sp.]|uniref:hypothetical protein n=1 Tax=Segniliparus sp. TaxID=2804064 RepID=UPI003F399A52